MKPNRVCVGDAIETMRRWPAEQIHLAFADPPYNIGYVYDAYEDDLPDEQFVQWCTDWMAEIHRLLTPDGSFYLAIGDDFAADLRIVGRKLGYHLRNWIIWHYTFGQNMRAKFSRAHTHILYFTKSAKRFTFNDQLLRFPSARHTEYQDLRASPKGRLPDDVWNEFPRVCGTFKERAGFHGCQLPEALLQRIVMASSNPGDVVLDPFLGSGTTAVAAKRLGRQYVGIELSKEYASQARRRLAGVQDESQAQPEGDDWPSLHLDHLLQLYRETRVSAASLVRNAVALRVIAGSLKERTGWAYGPEQIAAKLEALGRESALPKLPNDRAFAPRKHTTEEGKRYVRKVQRWQGRRKATPGSVSSQRTA